MKKTEVLTALASDYRLLEYDTAYFGIEAGPLTVAEQLVKQRERLLASVEGSSVPFVLNLSCQRTFKKPLVIGRRGCIQRALNGKDG
jgi:predicted solute-binding protein